MQIAQLRHARFGYEYFIRKYIIIIMRNIEIATGQKLHARCVIFSNQKPQIILFKQLFSRICIPAIMKILYTLLQSVYTEILFTIE